MIEEISGVSGPDVLFEGRRADLKSLSSPNNIVRHAKDAIGNQGAELVIFEFTKWDYRFESALRNVQEHGIHGYYYVLGENKLIGF